MCCGPLSNGLSVIVFITRRLEYHESTQPRVFEVDYGDESVTVLCVSVCLYVPQTTGFRKSQVTNSCGLERMF